MDREILNALFERDKDKDSEVMDGILEGAGDANDHPTDSRNFRKHTPF